MCLQPPKKKKSGKKGKKGKKSAKTPTVIDGISTEEMSKEQVCDHVYIYITFTVTCIMVHVCYFSLLIYSALY